MEFWGVEVKSGEKLWVDPSEGKILHLSQACIGEIKNNKSSESVCLNITVDNKKLVLGTLNTERLPQQLFDLVFDKPFTLSHNWKNGSVYFYGYKAEQPFDEEDDFEDIDTDEEEDALRLPLPAVNGKQEAKKEEKSVVPVKKDVGKQKVKIVEPVKDDDSDDSDSLDDDFDEDDDSSDDDVEGGDEDEEKPKKQISGKKRPNESSSKTPVTDKKAKMSTPQKTDGKKAGGHVDTPHPSKKTGNTPASSKNQKSLASAADADGEHSCKSCNRMSNRNQRASAKRNSQRRLAFLVAREMATVMQNLHAANPPPQPIAEPPRYNIKSFTGWNPPKYSGSDGATALLQWFEGIENVFYISESPVPLQVKYATSLFTKRALTWWNKEKATRGMVAAHAMPWADLKTVMLAEFFPRNEVKKLESEFWKLKQVGGNNAEYTTRFHELSLLVPRMVTPVSVAIEKYLDGLPPKIRYIVLGSKPTTLKDAVRLTASLTDNLVKDGDLVRTSW